jgi:hypothetical protein
MGLRLTPRYMKDIGMLFGSFLITRQTRTLEVSGYVLYREQASE